MDFVQLATEAGRVFTPTAPIDEKDLFSGRIDQIRQIIDVISQKGQHAILYGERGVGKTSLVNVLRGFLGSPRVISPRVNCDSTDTFSSVWRKVFEGIEVVDEIPPVGFTGQPITSFGDVARSLPDTITPDEVRKTLVRLSDLLLTIVIIDEFDRLGTQPKRAFSDLVKTLSDHAVPATIIFVGVADSVDQLIEQHQSVERALVQVRMPRMSRPEIAEIIDKGLDRIGLEIVEGVKDRIVSLSQGLPHYTHLLGLHSARQAADAESGVIGIKHLDLAIVKALQRSQQSIQNACHAATMGTRTPNLYPSVLLACALAEVDSMGYFAASDVREPLRKVTQKNYDIPSFSRHLNDFCLIERGPILQKTGVERRYRFRFINPLVQPHLIMQGVADGQISLDLVGT